MTSHNFELSHVRHKGHPIYRFFVKHCWFNVIICLTESDNRILILVFEYHYKATRCLKIWNKLHFLETTWQIMNKSLHFERQLHFCAVNSTNYFRNCVRPNVLWSSNEVSSNSVYITLNQNPENLKLCPQWDNTGPFKQIIISSWSLTSVTVSLLEDKSSISDTQLSTILSTDFIITEHDKLCGIKDMPA